MVLGLRWRRPVSSVPPTECAYAAGFFDGEGSVMIMAGSTKWKTQLRLIVSVAQVHLEPLEWLRDRFGGTLRQRWVHKTNRRIPYEWTACGAEAASFLEAIRPYLVLKAPHAELAAQFRATVQPRKGGVVVPLSPAIIEQRASLRLRMKALNRRGTQVA